MKETLCLLMYCIMYVCMSVCIAYTVEGNTETSLKCRYLFQTCAGLHSCYATIGRLESVGF